MTTETFEQVDNLDYAWERLHDKNVNSFLTGPAGSGKTTLIKKFIEANKGKCLVTAPTGIAAVNANGQTIHSLFQFPARPISKSSVKYLRPAIDGMAVDLMHQEEINKRKLFEKAEYLLIDEVSMCRADIMDQIFWFLEKNGFMHLKLIMIGDIHQLPPVVGNEEERKMLDARYLSEFFFDAKCWESNKFEVIRLTKIWRQSDPVFIGILNDIKNKRLAPFELDKMNRNLLREDLLKPEDGIMLCGTNKVANEVNQIMLDRLEEKEILLDGKLSGDFKLSDCPVPYNLKLKVGCRVMTMRNDTQKRYANGSIGTFLQYDQESNALIVLLDNGSMVSVSKYVFESTEFVYDKSADRIAHKITGSFEQFPLKVAYAITIHKSQGQTFDKVIIDLGEKGAFAHGQVYVALSRCRTMEGIILRSPLKQKDLIYHKRVLEFNQLNNV